MQTWKDDEFLLGFKSKHQEKVFTNFLKEFLDIRAVMYEQFMGDFTYRDSASRQVRLFIPSRLLFFHLQWYKEVSSLS